MTHPPYNNVFKPAALPLAVMAALTPIICQAQQAGQQDQLDTVIVTGSRIPRSAEVEGAGPVH
jgi:hypothetical protein